MSEYERKYSAALTELERSGIWRSNYAPPLHRMSRTMGLAARPPHYASFWKVVLGYGLWFGLVWGLLMWFWMWRGTDMPITRAIGSSLIAGALFGLMMAANYASGRAKYGLSRWDNL